MSDLSRTGWTIISANATLNTDKAKAFDGNAATFARNNSYITQQTAVIDLGSVQNCKTLRCLPNSADAAKQPSTVWISLSDNGVDYFQVNYTGGITLDASEKSFALGANGYPARYVMINAYVSSAYWNLAELNIEEATSPDELPTVPGTALSRSGWSATLDTYTGANALDSNACTRISPSWDQTRSLTVDMGSVRSISLVKWLICGYSVRQPESVSVYVSTNGTDYTLVGSASSLAATFTTKYVSFSVVSARYYRISGSMSSGYWDVAETGAHLEESVEEGTQPIMLAIC